MKQETDSQGRFTSPDTQSRRRAEAMKTTLAGGHVNGAGWRMEFLRQLARARADGLLTAEQIKSQLPADLLLAVEALAEELRCGNHVMPLVVLGNDWDFVADDEGRRSAPSIQTAKTPARIADPEGQISRYRAAERAAARRWLLVAVLSAITAGLCLVRLIWG
jgi:hypothetical protein